MLRGGQKKPFTFKTLGQLAAIGKRTGVANILGHKLLRLHRLVVVVTIYLSKSATARKEVCVSGLWIGPWDLVFSKDFVQFLTLRAPTVSHVEQDEHANHL